MSRFYSALTAERIGIRRSVYVVTLISLLVNVLLAGALLAHRPSMRTVIVPPTLADEREVWTFDETGPGAPYLQRYALSVVQWLTNVTPASCDAARERVLSIVDPTAYAAFNERLLSEHRRIKQNKIAGMFCPVRVHVDAKALTVDVDGIQKTLIGKELTRQTNKRISLTFRYDAGRLFLTGVSDKVLSDAALAR